MMMCKQLSSFFKRVKYIPGLEDFWILDLITSK